MAGGEIHILIEEVEALAGGVGGGDGDEGGVLGGVVFDGGDGGEGFAVVVAKGFAFGFDGFGAFVFVKVGKQREEEAGLGGIGDAGPDGSAVVVLQPGLGKVVGIVEGVCGGKVGAGEADEVPVPGGERRGGEARGGDGVEAGVEGPGERGGGEETAEGEGVWSDECGVRSNPDWGGGGEGDFVALPAVHGVVGGGEPGLGGGVPLVDGEGESVDLVPEGRGGRGGGGEEGKNKGGLFVFRKRQGQEQAGRRKRLGSGERDKGPKGRKKQSRGQLSP